MRFALVASACSRGPAFGWLAAVLGVVLAALPALAGCGSSSTPPADAAWIVNMDSGNSGTCLHGANLTEQMGGLSATMPLDRTYNGQTSSSDNGKTASISCSVTGSSTFAVSAKASTTEKELTISIPSITTGATIMSPAMGSAGFTSAKYTADNTYQGSCSFYFKPSTPESVAGGRIWGAFTCPMVASTGGTSDTCEITESFFLFEGCAGGM